MKIIHSAPELQTKGKQVCLAIGFFDGVHLGHQQIIRQTIQHAEQHEALPLVITFDQHPNVVVAPNRVPPWSTRWNRNWQRLVPELWTLSCYFTSIGLSVSSRLRLSFVRWSKILGGCKAFV
jgi:cytidyltransferase-like protein